MSKSVAESKTECPLAFTDPRSPSADISRTPIREVMRGMSSVKKSSSLCVVACDIFYRLSSQRRLDRLLAVWA